MGLKVPWKVVLLSCVGATWELWKETHSSDGEVFLVLFFKKEQSIKTLMLVFYMVDKADILQSVLLGQEVFLKPLHHLL